MVTSATTLGGVFSNEIISVSPFTNKNNLFLIKGHLELHQCTLGVGLLVETPLAAHWMRGLGKVAIVLLEGMDTDPGQKTFHSGTL